MRRSMLILAALVLLVCAFVPCSPVARAQDAPESAGLELVVKLERGSTPLPGARFWVYRAGEFDTSGQITLDDAYANRFSVTDVREQRGWAQTALDMAAFVKEARQQHLLSAPTLADGCAAFSEADGLTRGIYLVVGDDVEFQGKTYSSLPFLTTIPSWDPEEHIWRTQTIAKPKPGEAEPEAGANPDLGPTPSPTPPTTPSSPSTPSPWGSISNLLAQTGDGVTWCSILIAVCCLSLATWRLARKRK